MIPKNRSITLPVVLALAFIISQSAGAVVLAQDGSAGQGIGGQGMGQTAITPSVVVPGGPGFYAVSAFEFMPFTPSQLPAYSLQAIYNPGVSSSLFEAPVTLPQGVTVTKVVMYFEDNDATNLSATLFACPFDAAGCSSMVSVSSSGAVVGIQNVVSVSVVINPVINPQAYNYVVQLDLPPTAAVKLYGFRIDFASTLSLPILAHSVSECEFN